MATLLEMGATILKGGAYFEKNSIAVGGNHHSVAKKIAVGTIAVLLWEPSQWRKFKKHDNAFREQRNSYKTQSKTRAEVLIRRGDKLNASARRIRQQAIP